MPATVTACLLALTAIVSFIFYQQATDASDAQRSADSALMRAAIRSETATATGRIEDLASSTAEHWPSSGSEFDALAAGMLQTPAIFRVSIIRYLKSSQLAGYERRHGPLRQLAGTSVQGVPESVHRPSAAIAPSSRPAPPLPGRGAAPAPAPDTGPPELPGAPLQRGPPEALHFVVLYAAQTAGNAPLGVDLGGETALRIAMLAAANGARAAASAPVSTPTGDGGSAGAATAPTPSSGAAREGAGVLSTVLYVPVYRKGMPRKTPAQRLAALRGFVSGTIRDRALAATLAGKLPAGASYSLKDGASTLLSRGRPEDATTATVGFAGRSWLLTVGRPPADLSRAFDTLIAGGVLALLIGALSLQASLRERRALDLAERRIAERNLAESALATAERRFKTAFSEAPIGMALIAPDGALMQVNRSLARISRHSEQELLSLSCTDLTHPDDRSDEQAAMNAMRAGRLRVHDVEKRLLTAKGDVVWASVHTTLIRDEQDQPAYFLSQIEDITARHRYESRLQHMADHDPLTGLLNRRAFERALKEHLAGGEQGAVGGAVLVIDLDEFKQVNDMLGHRAGDELIVRVAEALTARLRSADVVARLGGDEFAVLLRSGGRQDVEQVAESLLATIKEQHAARGPGGRERPVGASIGVVPLDDEHRIGAEEALTAADLAMYDAKERGRDRSETFRRNDTAGADGPGSGEPRLQTRLEWVERIRAALDEDTFVLHAQPVVETGSGRITQYELLIRMLQDDGSLAPPASFLPVAERYGLVGEIDRWVIARAVAMLRDQMGRGRRPVVEINLSGQSLSDERLPEYVGCQLAAAGVSATQLIFEVTETAAIANIAAARSCADRLGALGCRFALDDFGAGFGSFYYVKHLPFDFIKIDGEFVKECTANEVDRLIVGAVVELAKGLGKRTIAEFVDDDETLRRLHAIGVDYAQGFHLGRPAPLEDWLAHAEGIAPRPDAAVAVGSKAD